jgi:hypothetical protein
MENSILDMNFYCLLLEYCTDLLMLSSLDHFDIGVLMRMSYGG